MIDDINFFGGLDIVSRPAGGRRWCSRFSLCGVSYGLVLGGRRLAVDEFAPVQEVLLCDDPARISNSPDSRDLTPSAPSKVAVSGATARSIDEKKPKHICAYAMSPVLMICAACTSEPVVSIVVPTADSEGRVEASSLWLCSSIKEFAVTQTFTSAWHIVKVAVFKLWIEKLTASFSSTAIWFQLTSSAALFLWASLI